MNNDVIKQYIRDPQTRKPFGVVVLVKGKDKKHLMGYSLCNPNDKFDKKKGTAIALARATCPRLDLSIPQYLAPSVRYRQDLVLTFYTALLERAEREDAYAASQA